jgi:hypothetical protein
MRIFISGLTGKWLLVFVFLLFLAGMAFGADKFTVTPPTFTGPNYEELNNEAEKAFIKLKNELNDKFKFLPDRVDKLAGGFANASVFSSDGASQRGYEGFNTFSFTTGLVFAFQLPNFAIFPDFMNTISNSGGKIGLEVLEDIIDIPFGFDPKISAQFGINTSFLLKGLYLGFKFSKFDTNWTKSILPISGFSFSTTSIGVNASYQLISQKRLLGGLLVWRGLNLGSGFIWQNTRLILSPALSIDDVPIPISGIGEVSMPINGIIRLDFETNTYIVPIEAMTSIRLIGFLNMALGAGVDIAFGSSKIDVSSSLKTDIDKVNQRLPTGVTMDKEPTLKLTPLGGKSTPSFFNSKIMFALGFNIGPAIIDIPVTYYFLSNGWSLGLTFGVTL